MHKLYKIIDGTHYYWEAWETGERSATFHYGVLGDQGKTDTIKTDFPDTPEKVIERELKAKKSLGFIPVPDDFYNTVIVHFKTGWMFGLSDDRSRRIAEAYLDEHIGWYGYGTCDYGTEEDGYYNIYCSVIDVENAVKAIKSALRSEYPVHWKDITTKKYEKPDESQKHDPEGDIDVDIRPRDIMP
ncbi:MAG TPA: hypothetical protein VK177_21335 [Flavobacteriales bacterium]|nr:hypothetical protein [Flavobacteriales bacterium]